MSCKNKEESKWKIGDLVTLSSAGMKLDQNTLLTKRNEEGRLVPYGFGWSPMSSMVGLKGGLFAANGSQAHKSL